MLDYQTGSVRQVCKVSGEKLNKDKDSMKRHAKICATSMISVQARESPPPISKETPERRQNKRAK